jgi:hypothetical protein
MAVRGGPGCVSGRTSVPQGLKPASSVGSGGTAEAVPFAIPQRYMAPITFSDNCAACHTLQFDKRFGNEQVPHEKPEVSARIPPETIRRVHIAASPGGARGQSLRTARFRSAVECQE